MKPYLEHFLKESVRKPRVAPPSSAAVHLGTCSFCVLIALASDRRVNLKSCLNVIFILMQQTRKPTRINMNEIILPDEKNASAPPGGDALLIRHISYVTFSQYLFISARADVPSEDRKIVYLRKIKNKLLFTSRYINMRCL